MVLQQLIEGPPVDESFLNDADWKDEIGGGLETVVEEERPTPAESRGYRPNNMPSYIPFSRDDPIINDEHIDKFPNNGGKSPPACISRLPSPLRPPVYPPPLSPASL